MQMPEEHPISVRSREAPPMSKNKFPGATADPNYRKLFSDEERMYQELLKMKENINQERVSREAQERAEKQKKIKSILDNLKIPHVGINIDGEKLVEILMDDEKFQELCSRVKLKVFW